MNAVDIAVVVVLLGSGVFALMRGFVYEALAMAGWYAAGLAAFWGLPLVRPFVQKFIANKTMADVAGGVGVFIVVLVVCSIITHAISRQVRGSGISSVDRSLGFVFGLLRGLLLASLCFILVGKVADEPQVLQDAKSRPLLVSGARFLESLVPSQLSGVEAQAKEAADALNQVQQTKDMYDHLVAPRPKSVEPAKTDSPPAKGSAYDTSGLERLIETTK